MRLPNAHCLALAIVFAAGSGVPAAADPMPDWWTASLGGSGLQSAPLTAPGDSTDARGHVSANESAGLDCLAKAISYEAAQEPLAGRQAVAQVILNRTRHRAFPKTICGVVFQGSERRTGCQFSFTCDGSLRRALSRRTWEAALAIARQAMAGELPVTVGGATHYHADYVAPRWAPSLVRVGSIGAHIFYRFRRNDGLNTSVRVASDMPTPPLTPASVPTAGTVFSVWGLPAVAQGSR